MKNREESLCELLMYATVMSRDASTDSPDEMPRALVIRSFWNEVCHQVANALCGSKIEIPRLLDVCDEMAVKDRIKNWEFVRQKVAP